uniref:Uncharacterized protein LOC111106336 isoform X3 n=1 Tax=Crassostrea virginica TaxID=6565 RepID=A0A8B8AZU6_CRAVI|nr:uncharacterized protein LOC111106336 isoform X3 [Crassostrea virginica]
MKNMSLKSDRGDQQAIGVKHTPTFRNPSTATVIGSLQQKFLNKEDFVSSSILSTFRCVIGWPAKHIIIIVLIQFESHLTIRSCDHPWRKSLSLNGTVTDFLNDVKNILSGFLTIKIPAGDIQVKELITILNRCFMKECWLYSMVDINNQNSMSLCVVGNKSLNFLYCNIITCTCNKKVKRNIESTVYDNNNSGGNKTHLKTASCEITYDEHVYWPLPFSEQHMTTLEAEKVSNKTKSNQYNTSLKEVSRDRQDSKDKGHQEKTDKTWPFVLSFLIGVCFGILVGIMFTFLYLKTKGSKTNETKSVLNSIYFKRTGSSDDLGQLEVREYSEIPEHFQENRSQQIGEIEILEHSEANTCDNDQCSSIIGECLKQDTKCDNPGRDFEDNACLTQNVLQEKKNNQYHCIADISSVTKNYFALESRKSKTPKQDTTSENHTDGDALYFILSKQQSISDIDKDCSETENVDRKIQQSNGAKNARQF